jgi:glycosidase
MIKYFAFLITAMMTITAHSGPVKAIVDGQSGIKINYQGDYDDPHIHYWNAQPTGIISDSAWPGDRMAHDAETGWYYKEFPNITFINIVFNNNPSPQTGNLSSEAGEWWYFNNRWYDQDPSDIELPDFDKTPAVVVHLKASSAPTIRYYDSVPSGIAGNTRPMTPEPNNWYRYVMGPSTEIKARFTVSGIESNEFRFTTGEWFVKDGKVTNFKPRETASGRSDFREETIYFVITTRFYDGDPGNNVYCWDDASAGNIANNDPAWRGDFKGLIQKLDYIKALGFSAIWITPIVENASGYDYHGYHALDFTQVDPRYESPGATYQDLIDAAHNKDMKIIQDVVFNHSGNFGEKNLFPMFAKDYTNEDTAENLVITDPYNVLPDNYLSLNPNAQYGARIDAMKEYHNDQRNIYHKEKSLGWEDYTVQTGQIAGDCVDLHTENPYVTDYLIDAYNRYIDMGVDAFRIDTVKHISRLVFDREFLPAFLNRGGENFFMFGEVASRYRQVWNTNMPPISVPFYTWKEPNPQNYPWETLQQREASVEQNFYDNLDIHSQPTSNNHYLNGNNYRSVNYSMNSGMAMIDFPMHWNFANAYDAYNVALGGDHLYNDATFNVTYVDSHDYAPDTAPEGQRFNQNEDVWAENLSLMFTFRGIPTLYYGSEIQFQKGAVIDVGPNRPLAETGRAYFGDHIEGTVSVTDFGQYSNATGQMATTLNHPLAKHIRALNIIRRSVPALQKGQYSTDNIDGGMAYKRRFTSSTVDSFALVSVSGGATFHSIPDGIYIDAVTGDTRTVSNGTLSVGPIGKGNVRVYVLNTSLTSAPGKVLNFTGTYIK